MLLIESPMVSLHMLLLLPLPAVKLLFEDGIPHFKPPINLRCGFNFITEIFPHLILPDLFYICHSRLPFRVNLVSHLVEILNPHLVKFAFLLHVVVVSFASGFHIPLFLFGDRGQFLGSFLLELKSVDSYFKRHHLLLVLFLVVLGVEHLESI